MKQVLVPTLIGLLSAISGNAWAGCHLFGAMKDTDPRFVENMNKFSDSCVANRQHPKTSEQKVPSRGGKTLYTMYTLYCCDKATDKP